MPIPFGWSGWLGRCLSGCGPARAYQLTERIDDAVRTLRDAADYFRDSALRMAAAETLLRAGRHSDAEAELNQILTSTPPD
ncbi:tetratricopeptide repeat protein [Micromonospora sp. CPCC 205371]|nr:tetratricopeptide repeat protein [Micromonospora sp. CPCC 205371]